MARFLTLASLLLPLVFALLACTTPASAIGHKKSCRACTCTLVITGNVGTGSDKDIDDLTRNAITRITGGDGYSWKDGKRPHNANNIWTGTINLERLCGNGGQAYANWIYFYFRSKGANTPATFKLDCDTCPASVRCRADTECEKSPVKSGKRPTPPI